MTDDAEPDDEEPDDEEPSSAARLRIAVLAADPVQVAGALRRLPRHLSQEIAKQVGVPAPVLVRDRAPARFLRRTESPVLFTTLADAIAGPCLDATIEVLGDRSDDPTVEELRAAIDVVAERFPPEMISLMLAATSASGAPAADACDEILRVDDRFDVPAEIPEGSTGEESGPEAARAAGPERSGATGPTPEELAARRERKARKARERERERARQRKVEEAARARRKQRRK